MKFHFPNLSYRLLRRLPPCYSQCQRAQLFWIPNMSETMWYLSFCAQLISPNLMTPSSTDDAADNKILSCLRVNGIPLVYTTFFLTHSLTSCLDYYEQCCNKHGVPTSLSHVLFLLATPSSEIAGSGGSSNA